METQNDQRSRRGRPVPLKRVNPPFLFGAPKRSIPPRSRHAPGNAELQLGKFLQDGAEPELGVPRGSLTQIRPAFAGTGQPRIGGTAEGVPVDRMQVNRASDNVDCRPSARVRDVEFGVV